jgi:phosphoribosylpyrophosphate synthetase
MRHLEVEKLTESTQGRGLLTPSLANRDVGERFNFSEKLEMANLLREAWNNMNFNRSTAEIEGLRNSNFEWGNWPDREAYALSTESGRELRHKAKQQDLYTVVNLETEGDILAMRTTFDDIGAKGYVIGTMYFPYQRGDRPELSSANTNKQELILLRRLVKDVAASNVTGMVVVDSHSPAFPWFALNDGIAVLDLTAIPAMYEAAEDCGFLEGRKRVALSSDGGALEMGLYVRELSGAEVSIQGVKSKTKEDGRIVTQVSFRDEDLVRVSGADVILPEDIISTGSTMLESINDLFDAGAERVVILATYPIFAEEALSRLGFDDRVKIVTTDGRTPMSDIAQSKNIIQVPIFDKIYDILELDRGRLDFWSREGRDQLRQLGLDLAPWQLYDLRDMGAS